MTRRTMSGTAVVGWLVVLLFVVAVVTGYWAVVGRGASSPSAAEALVPIDGYPQRIGFDRPSPELPDRPGPLAATMFDNDFGVGRYLGVTSQGRLWELPIGLHPLSPDGRFFLRGEGSDGDSQLSVQDLSTGDRRTFDDIGLTANVGEPRRFRYLINTYAPVYWSQDASAVLTEVGEGPGRNDEKEPPMVLDVATGALTPVAGALAAGFRSPSEVVTLTLEGGKNSRGDIVAITTDLETGDTQDLPLQLTEPWRGDPISYRADPISYLGASVSPDGSTLLLIEGAQGNSSGATLRLFSLIDGSESTPREVDDWAGGCASTWLGDDPVVPTGTKVAGSALVTADDSSPLVAVHHRLQSGCLELTPDALAAGPHEALFGTSTQTWTWYWQPLFALSLALVGLAWLMWRQSRGD